ncbi:MAG: hypothetical protein AAF242_17820, partial [Bacteroidota bacterium]
MTNFQRGLTALVFWFLIFTLSSSPTFGQTAAVDENDHFIFYQAIARDAQGSLYENAAIAVRISMTSRDGQSSTYFQEVHQVTTNEEGLFQLFIGGGQGAVNSLKEVPWDKENIYLGIEIAEANQAFVLASRTQMLTVPYAFVAEKAGRLESPANVTLRDQNIHWNTSGNNDSRPEVHSIGTTDNVDLVIKTNNVERAKITKEGQFQFFSGVDGNDTDKGAYPLVVEGSQQGIYIKVNGSRTGDNNFLTFADDSQVWGRVEGQTADELRATTSYQVQVALYTLSGVSLLGQIVAETAEAIGYAASGLGAGAAPPT